MSQPTVYIDTSTVCEGKLEKLERLRRKAQMLGRGPWPCMSSTRGSLAEHEMVITWCRHRAGTMRLYEPWETLRT